MDINGWSRRKYLFAAGSSVSALSGCSERIDAATENDPSRDENSPNREPYQLQPGTYNTIVIFRNDDPQPGFRSEALRKVEEIFIDTAVPLTSGVIPMLPDNKLTAESEFCGALRRRDRRVPELFEYSLHGQTHQTKTNFYGGSEFGGRSFEHQRQDISRGASQLTDCIGRRPSTFVPPLNTYDETTVQALLTEDIDVVSGGKWFTDQYYEPQPLPFEADGALHVPGTHDIVADWQTVEFVPLEELKTEFDEANRLFVCMLHYHHFTDEERLRYLEKLVSYVADHDDAGCMTLGTFGDAYLSGDLTWSDNSWDYAPNSEQEES
ncbi:DUF2334 domain-containing protein [Halorubrum ezzemoulense]|uniref:DUF2334 domain-containing protein n=1 Tax=Halorubrum ezzemoulense TaxID=337243 RepID=A0A256JGU6_HALEZ|nr:DUF2334 domain-containing protein [Halorubrum ezzemoulense]OYR68088.1 hypothetical protein DJ78_14185 [Halorubrum ezzemoulense]